MAPGGSSLFIPPRPKPRNGFAEHLRKEAARRGFEVRCARRAASTRCAAAMERLELQVADLSAQVSQLMPIKVKLLHDRAKAASVIKASMLRRCVWGFYQVFALFDRSWTYTGNMWPSADQIFVRDENREDVVLDYATGGVVLRYLRPLRTHTYIADFYKTLEGIVSGARCWDYDDPPGYFAIILLKDLVIMWGDQKHVAAATLETGGSCQNSRFCFKISSTCTQQVFG